jgi:hypothetical protein
MRTNRALREYADAQLVVVALGRRQQSRIMPRRTISSNTSWPRLRLARRRAACVDVERETDDLLAREQRNNSPSTPPVGVVDYPRCCAMPPLISIDADLAHPTGWSPLCCGTSRTGGWGWSAGIQQPGDCQQAGKKSPIRSMSVPFQKRQPDWLPAFVERNRPKRVKPDGLNDYARLLREPRCCKDDRTAGRTSLPACANMRYPASPPTAVRGT